VPILNVFDDLSDGDADPSNPTRIVSTSTPREFRWARTVDETKSGKIAPVSTAATTQGDSRRADRHEEDSRDRIIKSE
jgi:hypothetical protein